MAYSISGSKADDPAQFTEGTSAPGAGSIEIRIDETAFTSRNEVVALLQRLINRMLAQRNPRPGNL